MSNDPEALSPQQAGERLRIARDNAGLTQAAAAQAIGVARTTLISIEQGLRSARIEELRQLSQLYKTTINALLRQESVHVDFVPRFRRLPIENDTASNEAVKVLTALVRAEVEMESLLGVKRTRDYPPERPLLPGDVVTQAENNAMELRGRLGIGNGPITNMMSLLEFDLNIRVYIRKLDSKISGLFTYDDQVGACVLLNAGHPRERRAQTAAHECGHFISTRSDPEVLDESQYQTSREERYANAFGRAFLAPARAVMQKFNDVTAGADRMSRRHVIILAHYFGISREAMVRRMEEIKLIKQGTWEWFAENGGITDEQERQVLGDQYVTDTLKTESARPTTLRLQSLAVEVYRRQLLSESQLARLLSMDRVELRAMVDDIDLSAERSDGDSAPKITG